MKPKNGLALPPEEYAQLRAATPEQLAASEARNREIDSRMRAERARIHALREARRAAFALKRASGPTARLQALSVGESAFFEKRNATQLASTIRNLSDRINAQFQTRTERCLITGELRGVRVTRIK